MGVKSVDELMQHLDWFLKTNRFTILGLEHSKITTQVVREGRGGSKVYLVHVHLDGKTAPQAQRKARQLEADLLNFGHGVRPTKLARVTVQVVGFPSGAITEENG